MAWTFFLLSFFFLLPPKDYANDEYFLYFYKITMDVSMPNYYKSVDIKKLRFLLLVDSLIKKTGMDLLHRIWTVYY